MRAVLILACCQAVQGNVIEDFISLLGGTDDANLLLLSKATTCNPIETASTPLQKLFENSVTVAQNCAGQTQKQVLQSCTLGAASISKILLPEPLLISGTLQHQVMIASGGLNSSQFDILKRCAEPTLSTSPFSQHTIQLLLSLGNCDVTFTDAESATLESLWATSGGADVDIRRFTLSNICSNIYSASHIYTNAVDWYRRSITSLLGLLPIA